MNRTYPGNKAKKYAWTRIFISWFHEARGKLPATVVELSAFLDLERKEGRFVETAKVGDAALFARVIDEHFTVANLSGEVVLDEAF